MSIFWITCTGASDHDFDGLAWLCVLLEEVCWWRLVLEELFECTLEALLRSEYFGWCGESTNDNLPNITDCNILAQRRESTPTSIGQGSCSSIHILNFRLQ
jgi:hypothetical protein